MLIFGLRAIDILMRKCHDQFSLRFVREERHLVPLWACRLRAYAHLVRFFSSWIGRFRTRQARLAALRRAFCTRCSTYRVRACIYQDCSPRCAWLSLQSQAPRRHRLLGAPCAAVHPTHRSVVALPCLVVSDSRSALFLFGSFVDNSGLRQRRLLTSQILEGSPLAAIVSESASLAEIQSLASAIVAIHFDEYTRAAHAKLESDAYKHAIQLSEVGLESRCSDWLPPGAVCMQGLPGHRS